MIVGPITVRFYVDTVLFKEMTMVYGSAELGDVMKEFLKAYANVPHMMEVEFLELPENERFLRIGTDPRCMVQPTAIDIDY